MYSSVRRLEVDGDIEWYWGDEHRADGVSILGLQIRERLLTPTTKAIGSTQSACLITYCKGDLKL